MDIRNNWYQSCKIILNAESNLIIETEWVLGWFELFDTMYIDPNTILDPKEIYLWMKEYNLKWPLNEEDKVLFELTWG